MFVVLFQNKAASTLERKGTQSQKKGAKPKTKVAGERRGSAKHLFLADVDLPDVYVQYI